MANEVHTFQTNDGVDHEVQDLAARQAIASLQSAIDAITNGDTTTAIETFQEVIDFLSGVTDDETLIGKMNELRTLINAKYAKPSTGIPKTDLSQEVQDVLDNACSGEGTVTAVKMNNGTPIEPDQNGVVNLGTVITSHQDISGKADKSEMSVTDGTGANADKTTIQLKSGTSAQVLKQHQDVSHLASKTYVDQQIAQVEAGETIAFDAGGTAIIDNMEGPNADTTLAGASARAVKEIYINLKALYDTVAGLANIAFVGTRPTWQSVAKRTFTLTTSLTDCTADKVSGSSVSEGEVSVVLTPTTNYAFSLIAVTAGGNSVDFTRTDNANGTVTITFIMGADTTITATAISGYVMSMDAQNSSNVSILSQSHSGSTYTIILQADENFTMPSSVSVYKGSTQLSAGVTYTRTDNNTKATLEITNVDSELSIRATAIEDDYLQLTWAVSNMVVTMDGNVVSSGVKIHSGDVSNGSVSLVFAPASGYKWTAAPSGTGLTFTGSGDLASRTLEISSVSGKNAVSVTASVAALSKYGITLPSTNITPAVTQGDAGNDEVYEGEVVITLTPDDGYGLSNIVITMGGNTLIENTDYTISDNGTTKSITIANVTGVVVVTATAVTTNTPYKGVAYATNSSSQLLVHYGSGVSAYAVSPLVSLDGFMGVEFKCKSAAKEEMILVLYDANKEPKTYLGFNAVSGAHGGRAWGNGTSQKLDNYKYGRIVFALSDIASTFIYGIKSDSTFELLWDGSQYTASEVTQSYDAYIANGYYTPPQADENGYIRGLGTWGKNSMNGVFASNVRQPKGGYCAFDSSRTCYTQILVGSALDNTISPWFELRPHNDVYSIEFNVNNTRAAANTQANLSSYCTSPFVELAVIQDGVITETGTVLGSSDPRLYESLGTKWTHARLHYPTSGESAVYFKDATDDVVLFDKRSS